MNRQTAVVVVIAVTVTLALGLGFWRSGARKLVPVRPAMVGAAPMPPLPPGPRMPGPMFRGIGPNVPRLVATWATQAGPYTICVSYVRPQQDGRPFVLPRAPVNPRSGLGPFNLGIQILAAPADLDQVELDASSLRIRENMGGVLLPEPASAAAAQPVDFTGGMGYALAFPAPRPESNLFPSIEGDILLASGARRHFRISNVPLPLPRVFRIFGRMVPRRISADASAKLGIRGGLTVLRNEEAEEAIRSSVPAGAGVLSRPQRLIFTPAMMASIGIPSPAAPDRVRVSVSPGQLGRIDLALRFADEEWKGKLWNGDTVFVALPADRGRTRRAAAIRLSLEPISAPELPVSPPPFLPDRGSPGGSIASRVLVDDLPFGRGTLRIELRKQRSGGWSEPRPTSVFLNSDGEMTLSNVAPGIYSLQRPAHDLAPDLPNGMDSTPLAAYLASRFDVSAGRWEGETVDRLEVRTGQRTEIPPLRFRPSPRLAVSVKPP